MIPPKFRFASDFSEGLAAVCDFSDKRSKQQIEEFEAYKKNALCRGVRIPVPFAAIDYNPGREGHEN